MTTEQAKLAGRAAGFLSAWLVICFILMVLFLGFAHFIISNQAFLTGALRIN